MKRALDLLFGVALGAAIMYILDPDRGRRRRALVRDQVVHGAHEVETMGGSVVSRARHMRNRARGSLFEARRRLTADEVDDRIIEARVRSRLGHLVSDPSTVDVGSEHGRVTLRGMAPAAEFADLIEGIHAIPGVHDVINRLDATREAS